MITLVDSDVILDLVTDDPEWAHWSAEALSRAADESALAVNPLIFAEGARRSPTSTSARTQPYPASVSSPAIGKRLTWQPFSLSRSWQSRS